jgi:acetate---CoA ligase (ADP-forming)
MLGPNCLGLMDTTTPLNATFASKFPKNGNIAFISQSGAICTSILDWSLKKGMGFSKFISLGNKADLNEADFIRQASDDPDTKVILCYLEGVEDGRRFVSIAREASRKKPVVIYKSGTTDAGARAASSHTGALVGSDRSYETAFRQSGILRAKSMMELFELGLAFSTQPTPYGRRVAVVTNAGGPAIIASDFIESSGLTMARFQKDTIDALRENLPEEANVYNPVDIIGDAKEDRYTFALNAVLKDPGVDISIVILSPQEMTEPLETARSVLELKKRFPEKPVVTIFMGGESVEKAAHLLDRHGTPNYPFPIGAVTSVSGLYRYSKIMESVPKEEGPNFDRDKDRDTVEEIFRRVREDRRSVLFGSETTGIAKAYGIPAPPSRLATSPDEAVRFADRMGYPVALKIASPKILHKTDLGGVILNLDGPEKVMTGYTKIMENVYRIMPHARIYGVEVQKMMPKGRELIIGVTKDVQFGHIVMFGLGGIYVTLLKDVAFRLVDYLPKSEIEKMIRETKAYYLLKGLRGEKPADVQSVVDIIARTAALVRDFPKINELDINPVFGYEKGAAAMDIKITISR